MSKQTEYVAGFAFTPDNRRVVLIRKNRPRWQEGKLNGVGGHIESGEKPLEAMIREFQEETSVRLESWIPFCELSGPGYQVHFFRTHIDAERLLKLCSVTDEKILVKPIARLLPWRCIPNVIWLIQMALSMTSREHVCGSVGFADTHDLCPGCVTIEPASGFVVKERW